MFTTEPKGATMADENTSLKVPIKSPMGGLKKGILANKEAHDHIWHL